MISATYNDTDSTMTVTFRGESRTFPCIKFAQQNVARLAFGVMGGKYSTGSKVWPCNVTLWIETGRVVVEASGYGRGARCGGAVSLVGWYADVAQAHRSQVTAG